MEVTSTGPRRQDQAATVERSSESVHSTGSSRFMDTPRAIAAARAVSAVTASWTLARST